jgi:hypothetical protein
MIVSSVLGFGAGPCPDGQYRNPSGACIMLESCEKSYNDGISISTTVLDQTRANAISTIASGVSHDFSAHPGLSPVLGGTLGKLILQNNINTFAATAGINNIYVNLMLDATALILGPNYIKTIDE